MRDRICPCGSSSGCMPGCPAPENKTDMFLLPWRSCLSFFIGPCEKKTLLSRPVPRLVKCLCSVFTYEQQRPAALCLPLQTPAYHLRNQNNIALPRAAAPQRQSAQCRVPLSTRPARHKNNLFITAYYTKQNVISSNIQLSPPFASLHTSIDYIDSCIARMNFTFFHNRLKKYS